MKLWKSLKISIGKPDAKGYPQGLPQWGQGYELDVFKSQTSLSTDSGLCTERGLRRTHIELIKPPGKRIGLKLAGRSEPGVVPSIVGFTKDSVAHESDRLAPGDRICSVNGISTARLTNEEVLRLLDNVEERASLEVEYYMPNYASQNSLYITTKLAEVPVEKVNGSLGVTIRGGLPDNSAPSADLVLNSRSLDALPLVVTHVRPGGAAYNTSRIKPGDRLLKVDHISLTNKTLSEVHQILQNCPQVTSLTIEYDVSIMESVKLATGPLLIEIERPCNEDLGLFLSNQRYSDDVYSSGSDTYQRVGTCNAIYIDSILPASISDRCGALHPGDQLLAFDDHVIDGNNYTAEEVMCYLENCEAGFTRLHVAPRHVLAHGGRFTRENSMSGASTLNPKKQRQRNYRQSSMPKLGLQDDYDGQQNYMNMGVCRTESLNIQLEVPPGQTSGLAVHDENAALIISHVAPQSTAYRSGCLQIRDRVMSINGHDNLTVDVANEILQRRNDSHNPKYLTLNVEFSMPNTIEASSGVFNVKLAKTSAGLGVTITGCKQKLLSNEEPMVISDIKPGSVAHRSGALAPGDQLLAINGQPLHNLSLDTAFNILQNSPEDIITLKIRKRDLTEDWSNIHKHNAKMTLQSFSNIETKAVVHSGEDSGHHTDSPNNSAKESERSHGSDNGNTAVFMVEIIRQENGPLGLTIAGSEDIAQPILLSGLIEGGLAEKCGKLAIGDELLSINGESVLNKPLSEAIKLLQQSGMRVQLQMCRKVTGSSDCAESSVRDSSHSTSSPGLSNDSAVESWDQNTPVRTSANCGNSEVIEYAVPDKTRIIDKQPYSPTDEDKLMASSFNSAYNVHDLPLPNYSLNNSLKTFHYENTNIIPENTLKNKQNITREDDVQQIEILTSNMKDCQLHNMEKNSCKCDYVQMGPYGIVSPKIRRPNWDNDYLNNGIYTVTTPQKSPHKPNIPGTSFQFSTSPIYENDAPSLYSSDTLSPARGSIHHVILYKDAIYDDYGFSVSDGLYERGVYINRIRKGGPADIVGLLRPYDRILQVNGTRTVDYDCCLTVPLIAAAGDRLEIVVQRMATSRDLKNHRLEDSSSPSDSSIVTKTI
ncbi:glutamate receptor-interacting protein 2 isoform X1 [Maniola jurtina]|uniref:glutamate receptor-interacting protein 2 isoform X1 n=1 Tax=Maniola jurtina TaxID=191418 RepID=UPI001E68DBCC|nr:glutamate receptor-interacting protein 2 isoform X1 [Maniola jurtina]XP_045764880.1 glutamate receptor-interacting protein 2 isoform X1 [Maniola jurtina]